jgi:hypothetical protein
MKGRSSVGRLAKWLAVAVFGLLLLGLGGVNPLPLPDIEITHKKPYADFVGNEYHVVSDVSAYAWNDFPDKEKILSITLMSPPGVRNRFVSTVTPLQQGQRLRIVTAWRSFFGFRRYYVVLIPGTGLPEGVDVKLLDVNSDGVPDPRVYELIDEW